MKKIIEKVNDKINAIAIRAKLMMQSREGSVTVEAAILIVVAVAIGVLYLNKSQGLVTDLFDDIETKVKAMFNVTPGTPS